MMAEVTVVVLYSLRRRLTERDRAAPAVRQLEILVSQLRVRIKRNESQVKGLGGIKCGFQSLDADMLAW